MLLLDLPRSLACVSFALHAPPWQIVGPGFGPAHFAHACFPFHVHHYSTPDMGTEASPLESAHEAAEGGAAAAGGGGGSEGGTGVAFVVDAEASAGVHLEALLWCLLLQQWLLCSQLGHMPSCTLKGRVAAAGMLHQHGTAFVTRPAQQKHLLPLQPPAGDRLPDDGSPDPQLQEAFRWAHTPAGRPATATYACDTWHAAWFAGCVRLNNSSMGSTPPPLPRLASRAVTLFEGGRVYGQDVINELIDELHASVGEWGYSSPPLGEITWALLARLARQADR